MLLQPPLHFLESQAGRPVCHPLQARLSSEAKTFSFSFTVKTFQKDQQPEAGVFQLASTEVTQGEGSGTSRAVRVAGRPGVCGGRG